MTEHITPHEHPVHSFSKDGLKTALRTNPITYRPMIIRIVGERPIEFDYRKDRLGDRTMFARQHYVGTQSNHPADRYRMELAVIINKDHPFTEEVADNIAYFIRSYLEDYRHFYIACETGLDYATPVRKAFLDTYKGSLLKDASTTDVTTVQQRIIYDLMRDAIIRQQTL